MINKINLLVFTTMLLISISTFAQDLKQLKEKTVLVIIGEKQKQWTQKDITDSINWSKVESVNYLTDSVAIKKYGELHGRKSREIRNPKTRE